MSEVKNESESKATHDETAANASAGMPVLILNLLLMAVSIAGIIMGALNYGAAPALCLTTIIIGAVYLCVIDIILFCGLKILQPNEALVLTLFGKYYGTLRGDGFFFVNPFVSHVNPAAGTALPQSDLTGNAANLVQLSVRTAAATSQPGLSSKKISLKNQTLNNDKQKINDQLGNPIVIGIVVIWRVVNTAKAVFDVDNYKEFLSIQCDSALRNIVRLYPYDVSDGDSEKSLRGSSSEIAGKLKLEIQDKVDIAGLEIIEARITHLSYAQEIAAVMLQRQQASAIIDAKKLIVEGAVGMVEMALNKLGEQNIVKLDEERKAAMVSNLLVVLCGNRETQPVVNSGSLY
jgi:regulator of protease activity HflC (stomatin/prohibitin superfamily)